MGAEAYDDCIHVPCPRCQAERDAYCRNPMTNRPAQVPCLQRLRAAETDRETGSSTGGVRERRKIRPRRHQGAANRSTEAVGEAK